MTDETKKELGKLLHEWLEGVHQENFPNQEPDLPQLLVDAIEGAFDFNDTLMVWQKMDDLTDELTADDFLEDEYEDTE